MCTDREERSLAGRRSGNAGMEGSFGAEMVKSEDRV